MVDIKTEIIIDCPIEKVSSYASNPDHAPEWYVNIESAEWLTDRPLSLESQIAFKATFLGRELSYVYKIEEYISGQILIMRTADGPFPMKTTYTWEKLEQNGTKMTLRNEGEPSVFSKIFTPFIALLMKKANQKDLIKIKEILEK
ncbi:ATPase [Bacillus haikouensis]|uniref:SRPBCC family protein n=1 Tax=Bacillus haikouensis TaxID=1510468 RepID=UPI00155565BC|nr:SRPBCC family protein [Bacillus haikouensis]NQD65041.1 ATPase [Bacillus haikouensis]